MATPGTDYIAWFTKKFGLGEKILTTVKIFP